MLYPGPRADVRAATDSARTSRRRVAPPARAFPVFEQVRCARNDLQLDMGRLQACPGLRIEVDHRLVVTADNQQRGRAHPSQSGRGQVGRPPLETTDSAAITGICRPPAIGLGVPGAGHAGGSGGGPAPPGLARSRRSTRGLATKARSLGPNGLPRRGATRGCGSPPRGAPRLSRKRLMRGGAAPFALQRPSDRARAS